MAENLKKSEGELNSLLAVYWRLRHETDACDHSVTKLPSLIYIYKSDVYIETLANKLNMQVAKT